MYAIITTTGHDRVGIIAGISSAAAQRNLNIVDVSQTLMDHYFTMIMRVEIPADEVDLSELAAHLSGVGKKLGVVVRVQSEALFSAINEI
ncbi:ACT domain-containing protein [Corynebacterium liangguodongii]|uniref:UPF0237 protein C3E79_05705 n=1 Tax=Corynebacterium liangguodongii TaxID=2079535 RepID=A0A2S0WE32_9CORY|nr:ACT domain-containing protein [Corynebacterium liangguodongii]AWB84033.1 ACT domain-containing protein [Corynebacterium liangguodongii]PWC00045.1 ACT domain-containing protein [Corynebacterium liangguodongii]